MNECDFRMENIIIYGNFKPHTKKAPNVNDLLNFTRNCLNLAETSVITPRGIKEYLIEQNLSISISSISRITKMDCVGKIIHRIPLKWISNVNKSVRLNFSKEKVNLSMKNCILLCETGINLHCAANYRYSQRNKKFYVNVPGNRGVIILIFVC